MNIIDAAHKTVHDYPGGSESLGPRIGMSPAVLRNKVNPNNTTHRLAIEEADEIMGITDDHLMLHTLAAKHGFLLQKVELQSDTSDVLRSLLKANAAEGEFDRVLNAALADDLITPNELRAINEAGAHQQTATMVLLARLRAVSEQHSRVGG